MRDYLDELRSTVRSVVAGHLATDSFPDASLDLELWNSLRELDLIGLGASEQVGGADGDLIDSCTVLGELLSARVPYAEATVVAAPALSESGLELPQGTFTSASGEVEVVGGRLTGVVASVPFARDCDTLVLLSSGVNPSLLVISLSEVGVSIEDHQNLADEARDTVALVDVAVVAQASVTQEFVETWKLREALSRVVASAGVAAALVDQTASYALERSQFGRPLMKFQVIQHGLASMAADATAMQVAAISAATAVNDGDSNALVMVAAAKAESASLVRRVTTTAQQTHGAIGFTREYSLGALTTRLWAWREEYGNERYWAFKLAEAARGRDLWEFVTGIPVQPGNSTV